MTDLEKRRQRLESLFDLAYLDRQVFIGTDDITPLWPDDMHENIRFCLRLENTKSRIFAEANTDGESVRKVKLPKGSQIPDGLYHIVLMPRPEEYYVHDLRVQRRLPLWVAKTPFSQQLYGDNDQRRLEALEYIVRQGSGVYTELAKMQLERWSLVKEAVLHDAAQEASTDGSLSQLLSLLVMRTRYGTRLAPSLLEKLDDLSSHLSHDFPELNENGQLLHCTCQLLAGHDAGTASQMALNWLHQRSLDGFESSSAPESIEALVLALVTLVDFAEDDLLREMAAVVLDKLFFTLALDSYEGMFGFAQNGRLAATSGISRLLWGTGTWNQHSAGVLALACSEQYEVPAIIQAVALDHPDELWLKQNQAGVDKVTFKTSYGMLCSAQTIWQVTLGPDAVIAGTDAAQVVQWKDALVAYGGDVYFPAYAFNECVLRDGWVFARHENACVALWASAPVQWEMPEKLRLRTEGNIWLCQIGHENNFEKFQEKVLAHDVKSHQDDVRWTTLKGDVLSAKRSGELWVNNMAQPVSGFQHYDSPYCLAPRGAPFMEIQYRDYAMRLDFALEENSE